MKIYIFVYKYIYMDAQQRVARLNRNDLLLYREAVHNTYTFVDFGLYRYIYLVPDWYLSLSLYAQVCLCHVYIDKDIDIDMGIDRCR